MMGGWGGMMGFGIVVWVVIIGAIVWAVTRSGGQIRSASTAESARAVLDARLAKGEISIEEYRKLRDALQ